MTREFASDEDLELLKDQGFEFIGFSFGKNKRIRWDVVYGFHSHTSGVTLYLLQGPNGLRQEWSTFGG